MSVFVCSAAYVCPPLWACLQNSCLDLMLPAPSPAEPAVLSPDLGVTKQSPYPLLWEHEVKGTAAYDRHPLTSWPLSLLIHMNRHHRLHVAGKDTLLLEYIIHRIHPQRGTASTQGPHAIGEKKKKLFMISTVQCARRPSWVSVVHSSFSKKNNQIWEMTVRLQGWKKQVFTTRINCCRNVRRIVSNSCKS